MKMLIIPEQLFTRLFVHLARALYLDKDPRQPKRSFFGSNSIAITDVWKHIREPSSVLTIPSGAEHCEVRLPSAIAVVQYLAIHCLSQHDLALANLQAELARILGPYKDWQNYVALITQHRQEGALTELIRYLREVIVIELVYHLVATFLSDHSVAAVEGAERSDQTAVSSALSQLGCFRYLQLVKDHRCPMLDACLGSGSCFRQIKEAVQELYHPTSNC